MTEPDCHCPTERGAWAGIVHASDCAYLLWRRGGVPKRQTIMLLNIRCLQIVADNKSCPSDAFIESVKVHGILSPITVRKHKDCNYTIIDGARRLRAAEFIGHHSIPAVIVD